MLALLTSRELQLRDARSLEIRARMSVPAAGEGRTRRLHFTPDSRRLVIDFGEIGVVDVEGLRTAKPLPHGLFSGEAAALAFSPDGQMVATVSLNYEMREADQIISPTKSGSIAVRYAALTRRAVGGGVSVQAWPSGARIFAPSFDRSFVPAALAWSPDSTKLMVTQQGPRYVLINVPAGRTSGEPTPFPFVYGFYKAASGDGYSFVQEPTFVTTDRVFCFGGSGLGWHAP